MVAEQEFRTTTQTQTSQPTSSAQCVPLECANVPDVCNAEQSNDSQQCQQHDEPDDWDPDAKLKLKVGDVTITVKQHTEGRQADSNSWIAWTRVPCARSAGKERLMSQWLDTELRTRRDPKRISVRSVTIALGVFVRHASSFAHCLLPRKRPSR